MITAVAGSNMAKIFGLDAALATGTTTLKVAQMSATYLDSGVAGTGMTAPIAPENTFVVSGQFERVHGNELWLRGKPVGSGPLDTGTLGIVNLLEEPTAYLPKSYKTLQLHIPGLTIDEILAASHVPPVSSLRFTLAEPDPMMHGVMRAVLASLQHSAVSNRLYFDHIAHAAVMHLAAKYGEAPLARRRGHVALSGMQQRLVQDMMTQSLLDEPSLELLAGACGMPVDRFCRSFRLATGDPPHRWLKKFRTRHAQATMQKHPERSLADIALACGFADQSHMTRSFVALVGRSPSSWRRSL